VFRPDGGLEVHFSPQHLRDDTAGTLIRCLRWDEEGDQRLATMSPASWTDLIGVLEHKAGLPLLARRLKRAAIVPPPEVAAKLRPNGLALAVRNLQSRIALAKAIRAAERPALLLKGIDLAERLYRNPAHRSMGDVDFLVHEFDAMAYHHHLTLQGFRARHAPDAAARSVEWQRHAYYAAPAGAIHLPFELHWLLANGKDGKTIDMAGIWSRSQPHATMGPHGRIMAPDDLFLYLCLHLKNHAFEAPLINLWDIAELIEDPELPLDWGNIWQLAAEWRLMEAVRITLYLITKTLGVQTRHISDWSPDASIEELLPDGLALIGRHSASMPIVGARVGLLLAPNISLGKRVRALARGVFPSRLEIRLRYGEVDQGTFADFRSYWRRLRTIGRDKMVAVGAWMRGDGDLRHQVGRISRLRAHMEDAANNRSSR